MRAGFSVACRRVRATAHPSWRPVAFPRNVLAYRMTIAGRQSVSRYLHVLFAGCLLILIAATVLYLAFQDRVISFDEAGLQNPPYMLLHYGRMTYPIHG